MSNLRDTLTHILEHERQLAGTNEATTQQYVRTTDTQGVRVG